MRIYIISAHFVDWLKLHAHVMYNRLLRASWSLLSLVNIRVSWQGYSYLLGLVWKILQMHNEPYTGVQEIDIARGV